MLFGKIEFLNLLPFHIYIKKNIKSNQQKAIIEYKKSYPSLITKQYKKRQINSAFISSVESKNEKFLNFGIVAKKEVLSVLLIPGIQKEDYQSKTSNALAKILKLKGEVIIGDKALKFYHDNHTLEKIDLAKEWQNKYNLPFVFAVLCYNKYEKQLKNLTKKFKKEHIKIPQYILDKYSQKSKITKENIINYLKCIDYNIGVKEKRSLKLFLKLSKNRFKE